MSERGKDSYAYISVPSNTVLLTRPGTLNSVILGANSAGATVRIDDAHRFQQGTVSPSATSSNTIGLFTASITDLHIGFNTGLVVAVSSNASVTVGYE